MKQLLLTCCAVVALASCQKESSIDATLTKNNEMNFAPYAGANATRGTAINDNDGFEGTTAAPGSFEVAAYSGSVNYFGFNTVKYNTDKWENVDKMYWPNENSDLHFGAYYPSSAKFSTAPSYSYSDAHALTFGYEVEDEVSSQLDLMFALKDLSYEAPLTNTDTDESINLHFKHALTQIGFTATKDSDISVSVTSLKVCNVIKNGNFTATLSTDNVDNNTELTGYKANVVPNNFGSWSVGKKPFNYQAVMNFTDEQPKSITVVDGTTPTVLTSQSDVMMLLPQALVAWNPEGTDANDAGSYLAIGCKITHHDGEAPIVEGTVYVPFETKDIPYTTGSENIWKAGHKITYNLRFGGGYTKPGGGEDPEPGTTPKPEEVVPTLRDITYTVSVDEWIPVNGGNVSM